jgi:hypothetical protein
MKKLLICLITIHFLLPSPVWGEQDEADIIRYKYNPLQRWWKFRLNESTIKYNGMEDKWEYVYPGQVLRFDPADGDWEYKFPQTPLGFHPVDEKWFYHDYPLKVKTKTPRGLTPTAPID